MAINRSSIRELLIIKMNQLLKKIDHINIVVKELEMVKEFFLSLGFELQDQSRLKGDWISQTVGLDNVDAEYVRLTLPDDSMSLELISFKSPPINKIESPDKANTQGFRHLAFQVQNIEKTVTALKDKGIEPFSPIQEFTKTGKKLIYFRGPEGILLELAQYERITGRRLY